MWVNFTVRSVKTLSEMDGEMGSGRSRKDYKLGVRALGDGAVR